MILRKGRWFPRATLAFRISCQKLHARAGLATDAHRNGCSRSHTALQSVPVSVPGFTSEIRTQVLRYVKVTIGMWTRNLVSICARPSVKWKRHSILLLYVQVASEQFSLRFTAKDYGLRNTYGSVPMCESSRPPVHKHSTLLVHVSSSAVVSSSRNCTFLERITRSERVDHIHPHISPPKFLSWFRSNMVPEFYSKNCGTN